MKITLSIIIFLAMAALTAIGYTSANTFFFAGGSIASLMDLAAMPVIIPTSLLIVFGLLLYFYWRKNSKVKLVNLGIVMLLWFLSGRTVGMIVYPDGEVVTGWFYIQTGRFYICDQKTDCETTIGYHTKTESLPFWGIRIKNRNTDKLVFTGPFLWNRTAKLFNAKLGAGKYNR